MSEMENRDGVLRFAIMSVLVQVLLGGFLFMAQAGPALLSVQAGNDAFTQLSGSSSEHVPLYNEEPTIGQYQRHNNQFVQLLVDAVTSATSAAGLFASLTGTIGSFVAGYVSFSLLVGTLIGGSGLFFWMITFVLAVWQIAVLVKIFQFFAGVIRR